jgi:hypothetical protein
MPLLNHEIVFYLNSANNRTREVDVGMRKEIIRLMALSSLGILFLAAVAGSNCLTAMGKRGNQQTHFRTPSALNVLSVEPIGDPGSGRGQGPTLMCCSFKPFKSNTVNEF